MKKLSQLHPGQRGIVTGIETRGALKRRLVDMGITPGVEISVRKVAPLGDPIELSLRGYALSIRRSEAEQITIEGGGGR